MHNCPTCSKSDELTPGPIVVVCEKTGDRRFLRAWHCARCAEISTSEKALKLAGSADLKTAVEALKDLEAIYFDFSREKYDLVEIRAILSTTLRELGVR